jgi:hypothetical protein
MVYIFWSSLNPIQFNSFWRPEKNKLAEFCNLFSSKYLCLPSSLPVSWLFSLSPVLWPLSYVSVCSLSPVLCPLSYVSVPCRPSAVLSLRYLFLVSRPLLLVSRLCSLSPVLCILSINCPSVPFLWLYSTVPVLCSSLCTVLVIRW